MDLIIEAIEWILKQLFGEPEKPAEVQKQNQNQNQNRKPNPRIQRGPYNYGDEPPPSPSQAAPPAKTLDEILAEIRRQSQPQAPLPPPPPPPLPPPQRVAPAPMPAPLSKMPDSREVAIKKKEKEREKERRRREKERERKSEPRRATRQTSTEALPSETHADAAKFSASPQPIEARVPIASRASQIRDISLQDAAPTAAEKSSEARLVLETMRKIREASPEVRRRAARQAIVYAEIFGPPRCAKPYRGHQSPDQKRQSEKASK